MADVPLLVLDANGVPKNLDMKGDGTVGLPHQPVQNSNIADGANISLGAKADATAVADNSTASLIALFKRNLASQTALLSALGGAGFSVGTDTNPGQIMVREYFTSPGTGMWDDAAGMGSSVSRDTEIMFNGYPSVRLDPQGKFASATTTPGGSPLISTPVFKRRLQFPVSGIWGVSMWIRWTSTNNGTNVYTTASLYNRDGTNAYMSRIWIDTTVTPIVLRYLTTQVAAPYYVWTQFATCQSDPITHMYDLPAGKLDKAGQWSYIRLVTNFNTGAYVGCQFNQTWYDLTGVPYYVFASAGAQALHGSIEYTPKNSTLRYINMAQLEMRRYG